MGYAHLVESKEELELLAESLRRRIKDVDDRKTCLVDGLREVEAKLKAMEEKG